MKKKRKIVLEYLLIAVGVGVAVAGLNMFLVPGRIAAGGVSGIATRLYHLWNVPLGLSIIVLNIPLFVFGITADNPQDTLAPHYLAFFAPFLH